MNLQSTALPVAPSMPLMEEFRSNYDSLRHSMNCTPVGSIIAPCFDYLVATEKEGHKKFVARFPPESKIQRQTLKKLFIHALYQLPWIPLLPTDFLKNRHHPQRDHAIIRFQVKSDHGFDLYELINTKPLRDGMNRPRLYRANCSFKTTA